MGNISLALSLLVILCIDAAFFLGGVAIHEINPASTLSPYGNGSVIDNFDAGGYVLNQESPLGKLPSGSPQVSIDTGDVFTDTFTSAWNWIADTTGLTYLFSFLSGPYSYIVSIAPDAPALSFAVGAIWWGLTLFLIVAFLLGRND